MTLIPGMTGPGGIRPARSIQRLDGVFKGGGSLGAAYPGMMRAVAGRNMWFARVAGTSAGSILASLIAAGFDAAEIEFLCAPVAMNLATPAGYPSGLQAHEVDYNHFVDVPTPHDMAAAREYRHSIGWMMARAMVDLIAGTSAPMPNKGTVVDSILAAVGGAVTLAGPVRAAVRAAIDSHLPSGISVGDLLPPPSNRDELADSLFLPAVGLSLAAPPPLGVLPLVTILLSHLGLTGGMCKGDAFLTRMERILKAKVALPPGEATVRFKHLPIPLFVTATNSTRQSLVVYSQRNSPEMSVAEAVRRSMSVPLVWDARIQQGAYPPQTGANPPPTVADTGDVMVDGGVLDNLPVWLFLTPTNEIVENTAADLARPKLVGMLDGSADAPASWSAPAPPLASPSLDDGIAAVLRLLRAEPARRTWESALVLRLLNLMDVEMNGSAVGTAITLAYGQGGGAPVMGADIPLKGFGWLDADTTVAKFKAMAFRGWQGTNAAIDAAGIDPVRALIARTNPYA